jgi:hypothetical protein
LQRLIGGARGLGRFDSAFARLSKRAAHRLNGQHQPAKMALAIGEPLAKAFQRYEQRQTGLVPLQMVRRERPPSASRHPRHPPNPRFLSL